jgi:uncharacterized protein YndB with AHSA1/START domain
MNAKNHTSMEIRHEREIVIARTFNAPARVVFDAWTRADLVKRWWAPRSHHVTMAGCEADVRVGGAYRYVLRRDTGDEIAFSGTYNEIVPHTRLVYTQVFEPMRDAGEAVITVVLREQDGKTHLTSVEVYPSQEARDGAIAAGMESGMRETMDQLEDLLATLS